jgi:hypothetical protein
MSSPFLFRSLLSIFVYLHPFVKSFSCIGIGCFGGRNTILVYIVMNAETMPGNVEFIACVLYAIKQIF